MAGSFRMMPCNWATEDKIARFEIFMIHHRQPPMQHIISYGKPKSNMNVFSQKGIKFGLLHVNGN